MVKDKSANERYEYNQKILQTERELEDLNTQHYQLKNTLENFEQTTEKEFRNLLEIDNEMMKRGSFSAQWDFEENQGKAQFLKNFLTQQQENLTHAFSQESQKLEDQREQFQGERDHLPWD
ncbi:hypothetical protein [Lactococcus allomyrinae]|uniref:DUF3958 domain-containing protein n=1 Tax=Lactococcus allomyrinae TaxID=2419773 RepID=A0A387BHG7_9LACT|nr:hypothetical protein [Lactococcus allomyrinae]AYG00467.1 hypothetical protein D7I46_04805 [Lactococcus allomyrinae]